MTRPEPVFIHSLHRSGSTYLFHVFRRARINGEAPYTCFQEPIHEIAFSAKDNPETLNHPSLVSKDTVKLNRHPEIGAGYFSELYEAHGEWKDVIKSYIIYGDYFGRFAVDEAAAYLQALVGATSRRTIIQECRTPLRMGGLKERLGGVHIHLWRNPWDQWWSLKVTDYFATVQQLILNARFPPEPVQRLKAHIGFDPCSEKDLSAQFEFYRTRRLRPEHSYLIDFMLFMLAMIEGETAADIEINIDLLSNNPSYARERMELLEAQGIQGIDLSDCASPQAPFGDADRAFFAPLEEQVVGWLKAGGCDPDAVERALERRRAAEPDRPKLSKSNMRLLDEVQRRGDLVLRIERQEADVVNALSRRISDMSNDIEKEIAARATLAARLTEEHGQKTAIEAQLVHEQRARTTAETALADSRRELHKVHQSNHHHWQLAEARAAEIVALRGSTSWRITAPLRAVSEWSRWFEHGSRAWITLKPGTRPRRVARTLVLICVRSVLARPRLAFLAKRALRRMPTNIRGRVRRIVLSPSPPPSLSPLPADVSSLSPRAREIHAMLTVAMNSAEKSPNAHRY